jgi:hypothetical protein
LEDHADPPTHFNRIDLWFVDVLAMKEDFALGARLGTRSFMRLKARSTVLLPQPDGPISAVIFCRLMLRLMSRTARKLP